jgi:hypothetical protein
VCTTQHLLHGASAYDMLMFVNILKLIPCLPLLDLLLHDPQTQVKWLEGIMALGILTFASVSGG